MFLLRKRGDIDWRAPETSAYANEAELQAIIAKSPALLPGIGATPIVTVREMELDPTRYPDVVTVDESGEITIVECKLKHNSEIRRAVIGQILSYAAGLWGLSYEDFDARFSSHSIGGKALADQIRTHASPDWNEEVFRAAVAANLKSGRFHLVIAVDEITDELKGIVRYLNTCTSSEFQIVALELRYSADDGVEILVPTVYGQESADQKSSLSQKDRSDVQVLLTALKASCSPTGFTAVHQICEYVSSHGGDLLGGTAKYASASVRIPIHDKPLTVFNLYADQTAIPTFSINFEYLAQVCSTAAITTFAKDLRECPELAAYLKGLEAANFKKRPSIPISDVLGMPGVVGTIIKALDELLDDAEA